MTRGYGKPSDRDSGSDDEDMSDDGQEDTLNNTSREKGSEAGHQRLEFVMGDTALPRDMTVYQASSSNLSEASIVSNRPITGGPAVRVGSCDQQWLRVHG